MSLQSFTNAYIEALLFSSNDESNDQGGDPLDKNYGPEDFSPEARAKIDADCKAFYDAHGHLFTDENCKYKGCTPDEYAGHDFWLTRQGHGCGFWDGDWAEDAAETLDKACKALGELYPCVGDDGQIHF
jgi:hypothetical protein